MIAVCSHDAGGAEILSSYVRRNALSCNYCLSGPAEAVFGRRLGRVAVVPMEAAIAASEWLLCGTSYPSDFELRAVALAKAAGKRVVAFLDHWVNYEIRFARNGVVTLPDEIWVGDQYAFGLATKCFPDTPVCLVPNPYFEETREHFAVSSPDPLNERVPDGVLYVCEDLGRLGRHATPDSEREAITYFLSRLEAARVNTPRVTLRPHPSDEPGKYDWVSSYCLTSGLNLKVVIDNSQGLLEQMATHACVAGRSSMALVTAVLAGKRVLSFIPPGSTPCTIPFSEIEHH